MQVHISGLLADISKKLGRNCNCCGRHFSIMMRIVLRTYNRLLNEFVHICNLFGLVDSRVLE